MHANRAALLLRSTAGYALALSLSMVFISGGTPNLFGICGGYWQTRVLSALFMLGQMVGMVGLSIVGATMPRRGTAVLQALSAALVPSYLLYAASALLAGSPPALSLLAAAFLGFSTAGALLLWIKVAASRLASREVARTLAAGTILSGALNFAFSLLVDVPTILVALGVMVVAHSILTTLAVRSLPNGPIEPQSVTEPHGIFAPNPPQARVLRALHIWWNQVKDFGRTSWRLMALVAAAELAGGMARAMLSDTQALDQLMLQAILLASFALGAGTVIALEWRFSQGLPFERVYLGLFLAEATFFLPAPFLGADYLGFLTGIENVFVSIVSIYLAVTCVQLAQKRSLDSLFTSGLLLSIASASAGASLLLGSLMGSSFGSAVVSMAAVYAILIIAVGASVVFARTRSGQGADQETDTEQHLDQAATEPATRPVLSFVGGDAGERIRSNPVYRTRYGLSEREIELLYLALSGRNAASMATTLSISENTVRFHLKNLYRKFDVHSKQELLAAVERIELEGTRC